jgi:hypothetical protein
LKNIYTLVKHVLLAASFNTLAALPQDLKSPNTFLSTLNSEAANSSSEEGATIYSRHLVATLTGGKLGTAADELLSARLARAQFMAAHGKHKSVSEAQVASAFNSLMRMVEAPPKIQVTSGTVHKFREILKPFAPQLITLERDASGCDPGEAVTLVILMIFNPEPVSLPADKNQRYVARVRDGDSPSTFINNYAANHKKIDNIKLFDTIAHNLSF